MYDAAGTGRWGEISYDALGRRVQMIDDMRGLTTDYYYDGDSEIVESNSGQERYYVHGLSYPDEHIQMWDGYVSEHPYYYVQDRMYNVWAMIDRTGALIERTIYDSYGRQYIRESAGRGDFDNNTQILSASDGARYNSVKAGTAWDPRGDMDDDESVDTNDDWLFNSAVGYWNKGTAPTVAQAFSDVYNPFGFQGRVHLPFNTDWNYQDGELMLVDHRARINDPVTGRWMTRDPIGYADGHNLYQFGGSNPVAKSDPFGLYEKDVHFYMTYMLGSACGFGPDLPEIPYYFADENHADDTGHSPAYVIAWADQYTDVNSQTEPFTPGPIGQWGRNRSRFHFRMSRAFNESVNYLVKRDSVEANEPVDRGLEIGDAFLFGIGLHAWQDSYSHEGFDAPTGHIWAGHYPDRPYNDHLKAFQMARATFLKMGAWRRRMNGELPRCSNEGGRCKTTFASISGDLMQMIKLPSDFEDYRAWIWHTHILDSMRINVWFDVDSPMPDADSWEPNFTSVAGYVRPTGQY